MFPTRFTKEPGMPPISITTLPASHEIEDEVKKYNNDSNKNGSSSGSLIDFSSIIKSNDYQQPQQQQQQNQNQQMQNHYLDEECQGPAPKKDAAKEAALNKLRGYAQKARVHFQPDPQFATNNNSNNNAEIIERNRQLLLKQKEEMVNNAMKLSFICTGMGIAVGFAIAWFLISRSSPEIVSATAEVMSDI